MDREEIFLSLSEIKFEKNRADIFSIWSGGLQMTSGVRGPVKVTKFGYLGK